MRCPAEELAALRFGEPDFEKVLDMRHAVMWPEHPRDFSRVDGDAEALHMGAFLGDKLICIASLFETDTGVRLRKFATLPEFQGRGVGSVMLQRLIDSAAKDHQRIWLSARLEAMGFYSRFGFREFGARKEKGGRPFCYMERGLP